MPYRICKTLEIENGHLLTHHPDKCRFPHGHSRLVEIILEAETLDAHGMVCDFKAVKDLAEDLLERFDHALCVNTEDPLYATLREAYGERVIPFVQTEPTTEVLAATFFAHLQKALARQAEQAGARYPVRGVIKLRRVRVWETSSSWAEYEEP